MTIAGFTFGVCGVFLLTSLAGAAQQLAPGAQMAPSNPSQRVQLDVTVETKAGEPVRNLQEQNFKVLDNGRPRPITSFRLVTPAQEPVEVILFLDAVNIPYTEIAFVRDQTEKFLRENGGKMPYPTTIAVFKDEGVQFSSGFSRDGNALGDALQHYTIGLRSITRDSQWSDSDRLTLSINALHQITTFASSLPGRKFIIWVSPGYPLLSGPGVTLTAHQQQEIFTDLVGLSSQLRRAQVTLYDVNPLGVAEPIFEANYYQTFLKGVLKPEYAQFADISIQVLSVQTGGLTIESNSDVSGLIGRCLQDADSWYEIGFDPQPADKPNEYHKIEIKLNESGLVARTRTGYYSNPLAANPLR